MRMFKRIQRDKGKEIKILLKKKLQVIWDQKRSIIFNF